MKRARLILFHCVFWTISFFLTFVFFGILSQNEAINKDEVDYYFGIVFSLLIIPAIFSFYLCYFFLFQKYLKEKKSYSTLVYGIYLIFIVVLIGCLSLLITNDFTLTCHRESNFLAIPTISIVGIIFGSIAIVFKGFLTWLEEIKLKEELLEKNYKIEMALVKSQLDPHFLFNTINNIDILILKNAEKASNYLNKLSDIMRFMLFETKIDWIPLKNELTYIEKYIELQKIRTSNSNYVTYEVIGDMKGKSIAPMIFIPFIENAFKHADNKKAENAIAIKIQISNDEITLNCDNEFSVSGNNDVNSYGLGNELIERRLNLIYPNVHSLEVNKHDNRYCVKLTVPNGKI